MVYGHGNKKRACVCTRVGAHVYKGRHAANVSCPGVLESGCWGWRSSSTGWFFKVMKYLAWPQDRNDYISKVGKALISSPK